MFVSLRRAGIATLSGGLLVCTAVPAGASDLLRLEPQPAHASSQTGESLYRAACANCHGVDGQGAKKTDVGFEEPLPDFTDCSFSTREPDADWLAIVHEGGPARAFARMMPAFGGALTEPQLRLILDHVRGFCGDRRWPRGELNLPRPLVTEKAFPEDEVVVSVAAATESPGAIDTKVVYERRFGPQNQFEIVLPVGFRENGEGEATTWTGGAGDLALAVKRALYHDVERGSIFSVAAELIMPTGNSDKDLGKGTAVVEPFVAFGQILPADSFLQVQGGVELPFDTGESAREAFWRVTAGRSFSHRRWGRTWTPMVELLGARPFETGASVEWDIVPQMQVTLSTRQHIMVNAGVRFPLNNSGPRQTEVLVYLLWDWFDGPLFGGW
jgi:mono/diheme cytochrome c family protein